MNRRPQRFPSRALRGLVGQLFCGLHRETDRTITEAMPAPESHLPQTALVKAVYTVR